MPAVAVTLAALLAMMATMAAAIMPLICNALGG
jgi:hypothetical protein